MSKGRYYAAHAAAFRAELAAAVPKGLVRDWHRRQPARHFAVAARQFVLLGLVTWALVRFDHPAVWIPLAVVQGFTVFNFTVLLHEVVHHAVFARRRPRLERMLGYAYAVPSGISAAQFTRWHLDHHAELGSSEDDPKRRHLSPKANARWLKGLYCTPALFPIYFRAARRETANYGDGLRRTIARERAVSTAAHVLALASLAWGFGWGAAARAYILPVFFVFPVAFTLNRLGQHYSIDPKDPAGLEHADARPLVLGHRLPQFQLPPRTPLLPGRPVLPFARRAAGARPVLRAQGASLAQLWPARVGLVRREPGAAHGLEEVASQ